MVRLYTLMPENISGANIKIYIPLWLDYIPIKMH